EAVVLVEDSAVDRVAAVVIKGEVGRRGGTSGRICSGQAGTAQREAVVEAGGRVGDARGGGGRERDGRRGSLIDRAVVAERCRRRHVVHHHRGLFPVGLPLTAKMPTS